MTDTLALFQSKVRGFSIYPQQGKIGGLVYATLGLTGEAGEVANQVKKVLRDDNEAVTPERRDKIIDELGDVQFYLAAVCNELGIDIREVLVNNINKLDKRRENGQINGDRRDG